MAVADTGTGTGTGTGVAPTPEQARDQTLDQAPDQAPDQALAESLLATLTTRLPGLAGVAADDQMRLREQARALAAEAIMLSPAAAPAAAPAAFPEPATGPQSALAAMQRMDRVTQAMRSPVAGPQGADAGDLAPDPTTTDFPPAPPMMPSDLPSPPPPCPPTPPPDEPSAQPTKPPAETARSPSPDPGLRPGQIPAVASPVSAPPPSPRLVVRIGSNARAGEPYHSPISVTGPDGSRWQIRDCQVSPNAGVRYADDHLSGPAPVPGEYCLTLACAPTGAAVVDGADTLVATATLIVNPDPRSLWRELPSDRDAPGWKPDLDGLLLAGVGPRRLLAVSQRGRSHAHHGGFRDDDFALAVTDAAGAILAASGGLTGEDRSRRTDDEGRDENRDESRDESRDEQGDGHAQAAGWNLLAVADGAGSAPRARIGSRVAVETAVRVAAAQLAATHAQWPLAALAADPNPTPLVGTLAYQVLGTAAFEAVKAIEAKAREQGCEPRDYATTLLLAVHRPLEQGELILTFWVGDGAVAAFDRDSGTRLLGTPDGGAFAGQTRFLDRDVVTDGSEIARRIGVAVLPRLDALFLLSDGVSDPWFPSDAALREPLPWQRLWDELAPSLTNDEPIARMQDWLGFWSVGNHDDRTLAVLW